MAYSFGATHNPFVQQVDGSAAGELNTRATLYGRKIRTAGRYPSEVGLAWSYGKKPWGRVTGGSLVLGLSSSTTNSNLAGDLTLYTQTRHLPRLPLLMGIDVSNEGAMGSLIKGSFSFTVYPNVSRASMALGAIENAFFKPGNFAYVSFGWTVYASSACASMFGFSGVITNFNWSVNIDMSVSATIQVISAATISVGAPGANTINTTKTSTIPLLAGAGTPDFIPNDPKGAPVIGYDLATIIDEVMAVAEPQNFSGTGGESLPKTAPAGSAPHELYGIQAWQTTAVNSGGVNREGLEFFAMGIPWQPEPATTDEVKNPAGDTSATQQATQPTADGPPTPPTTPPIMQAIVKKYYYVSFGSIEEYLNRRLAVIGLAAFSEVNIKFNRTQGYRWMKSAYPTEIMWNIDAYGAGTINPPPSTYHTYGTFANTAAVQEIGGIWIGVDYLKATWRKFFTDAATEVTQKNITGFLNELCKRINEAGGDSMQLAANMVEDVNMCGGPGAKNACLSVEDMSYSPSVGIFKFEASMIRPMIKSVSVSCTAPSAIATAAYVGPQGGDLDSPTSEATAFGTTPTAELRAMENIVEMYGINLVWGDSYRALMKKAKKAEATHHSLRRTLYPINFSVTVDGISGFKFGDAVTTNLIPSGYAGVMFFTVTKINHKVDANAWETTLNTAARMI